MSVHSKFVAEGMKTSKTATLWSAIGHRATYPIARVQIVVDEEIYNIEAAMTSDLLKDVLLGVHVCLMKHIANTL